MYYCVGKARLRQWGTPGYSFQIYLGLIGHEPLYPFVLSITMAWFSRGLSSSVTKQTCARPRFYAHLTLVLI